jgi:hypothetical protein
VKRSACTTNSRCKDRRIIASKDCGQLDASLDKPARSLKQQRIAPEQVLASPADWSLSRRRPVASYMRNATRILWAIAKLLTPVTLFCAGGSHTSITRPRTSMYAGLHRCQHSSPTHSNPGCAAAFADIIACDNCRVQTLSPTFLPAQSPTVPYSPPYAASRIPGHHAAERPEKWREFNTR